MLFGASQQTAQITTGNVRTTYDPYKTTGPIPPGGLPNALGTTYYDVGGAVGAPTSGPGNPAGVSTLYKYVLYKSTTNPALVAAPAIVYYTDNTYTVVSGTLADGLTGKACDAAGLLMPNTTDVSGLTAAILNNSGNGSGVWIAVGGYVKGGYIGALTIATGDYLYGTTGNFISVNVADGAAAPIHLPYATAQTVSASNKSDLWMRVVTI